MQLTVTSNRRELTMRQTVANKKKLHLHEKCIFLSFCEGAAETAAGSSLSH